MMSISCPRFSFIWVAFLCHLHDGVGSFNRRAVMEFGIQRGSLVSGPCIRAKLLLSSRASCIISFR